MRSALIATVLGLLAGCAAEEPVVFERVVVHCYRTLAAPECFAQPTPDEQGRLLGVGVSGFFAVPARAAAEVVTVPRG